MNRLHVIKMFFQLVFVFNCVVLYVFLMGNNEEQVKSLRRRQDSTVPPTFCYGSNNTKTHVEDLLSMPTPIFEDQYKNPCFYETCKNKNGKTQKIRCLPYFHILGVDKCGTTDLFLRLLRHPQVLGNRGSLNKETMWWSWRRYGLWLSRYKYNKETFHEYLQYFDNAAATISNHSDPEGSNIITGDGTPMDFWDFTGWRHIVQNKEHEKPVVLTPHLMKHMNPKVKFIVLLRNPTDRLYSDYMFLKLGTRTAKGFSDAVGFSTSFLKNCVRNHTMEHCLYNRKLISVFKARLHIGFYSIYLKEWLKVFSRDQFLILRSEDYDSNIPETLKKVFQFLKIDDLSEQGLERISLIDRAHQTTMKKKQGPMLKKTLQLLNKVYKPYNEELAVMLNDSRFLWEVNKKDTLTFRKQT